ncbi:putative F-box protein At1g47730 [Rutidosis leptorrhynchoides]|uniref:putative F-box protein At1g47730 n=1 Tax=Rutidosis leptorrhynchoides TaxID=125765 RepID=UPI003A99ACAB
MRFRSVSKPWKSLIDSSHFVSDYNLRPTQSHLFIMYEDTGEGGLKCVSVVNDDTFPEHVSDISAVIPNSVKNMSGSSLVGSSQGLLCFYGYRYAVIWNPSIRKSFEFKLPHDDVLTDHQYKNVFGFGVCPKTREPKLVMISFPQKPLETQNWTIDVFTTMSRLWRNPCIQSNMRCWKNQSISKISNVLCKSLQLSSSNECVGEFIYWCAFNTDDALWVVISFDVTNEEFGIIHLPKSIARYKYMDLSKYKESLVLLPHDYNIAKHDYDVWMMEGGTTKSFKRLFTINTTYDCVKTMAFSYNGEAILERLQYYRKDNVASVDIYEPSSKCFKCSGIRGIEGSFSMSSYMETLFLDIKLYIELLPSSKKSVSLTTPIVVVLLHLVRFSVDVENDALTVSQIIDIKYG